MPKQVSEPAEGLLDFLGKLGCARMTSYTLTHDPIIGGDGIERCRHCRTVLKRATATIPLTSPCSALNQNGSGEPVEEMPMRPLDAFLLDLLSEEVTNTSMEEQWTSPLYRYPSA